MHSKLFYQLKPFIPRRMQFVLRRMLVRIKLSRYRAVWPIDRTAAEKPEWFSGWPEGKKACLLITHDVEQAAGLRKVRQLMEVDAAFGLRTSFGLVPGRYNVDDATLAMIKNSGSEVYVHDLYHDGKLFSNYETFHAQAMEINRYLHRWNVKGFRAGAMHHNLDWIGELDITYDMSTFDTDPFEPMPDGVKTIFPFLASSTSTNRFFVEIPYTLPQDLMTFVIHPERSIDLWVRKLEWVVKNGGMVSVNIHPDYIAFDDEKPDFEKYPVKKYREFLTYVKDTYGSLLWNAYPGEIARFVARAQNVKRSPGGK